MLSAMVDTTATRRILTHLCMLIAGFALAHPRGWLPFAMALIVGAGLVARRHVARRYVAAPAALPAIDCECGYDPHLIWCPAGMRHPILPTPLSLTQRIARKSVAMVTGVGR